MIPQLAEASARLGPRTSTTKGEITRKLATSALRPRQ
jgi:hypothetical protein